MAIVPYRGKFHVEYFMSTTGLALAIGDMVTILASAAGVGTLAKATSSSPVVIGTVLKAITSASAEYTTSAKVPVLVANDGSLWKALTTTNGGQTEVGQFIDVSDEVTLDGAAAYTYGVAEVKEYVSTTSLIVRLVKKTGPSVTTA